MPQKAKKDRILSNFTKIEDTRKTWAPASEPPVRCSVSLFSVSQSRGPLQTKLTLKEAQNVEQSKLGRCDLVGAIPADQGTIPAATTKAASPLQGTASYRPTVRQLLKSVVRQIRTLRSVGAGGGQPPPATRWAHSNMCPYRDPYLPKLPRNSGKVTGPPSVHETPSTKLHETRKPPRSDILPFRLF